MKKLLILLLATMILAGCATQSKKVIFNAKYTSPNLLPHSNSYSIEYEGSYYETRLMTINPASFNKVRGTHLAYRPKVTLKYTISPESKDTYKLQYSGEVDYLSTINIRVFNGVQTIDGTVEKHVAIPTAQITAHYGQPVSLQWPDDLKIKMQVDKQ